jgi:hypothetical protein
MFYEMMESLSMAREDHKRKEVKKGSAYVTKSDQAR